MTLDEQINPMTRLKSQVPLHLAPFDVAVHFVQREALLAFVCSPRNTSSPSHHYW
jgi:hypothetical protein